MGTYAPGIGRAAPALLFALSEHLRNTGSTLPSSHALDAAIRAWIDDEQQRQPDPAEQGRGYQWKQLFLPDSTDLRMECAGSTFYGKVVGDNIMYGGRSVSPRGMTVAIAGEGRNAWRDLSLRLPGARYWKQAMHCRREHARHLAAQLQSQSFSLSSSLSLSSSPADSMAAAAASMADALKTTLALVQHCTAGSTGNTGSTPKVERRARKHRREGDLLGDDCAFS